MLFSSNIQIKCTILRSSWEKGMGDEEEEGGLGPSHSEICLILSVTLQARDFPFCERIKTLQLYKTAYEH